MIIKQDSKVKSFFAKNQFWHFKAMTNALIAFAMFNCARCHPQYLDLWPVSHDTRYQVDKEYRKKQIWKQYV